MAKKKSWLHLLKRFFVSESESRLDKGRRKRWAFARLKVRRLVASSALSPPRERRREKAEEEQSKNAINVDVERIGEAAKTPEVEAEMASLKEETESIHEPKNETLETSKLSLHGQVPQKCYLYEKEIEDLAATRIQTAFRGYLARKALRALKGLVRLQAIIRGRAVRRQAMATLKSLQSIVNIQSEVCAKRCNPVKSTVACQENTLLDHTDQEVISPIYVPRRSFHHRRQQSSGDDNSFMGSPAIPTYMAATESAIL